MITDIVSSLKSTALFIFIFTAEPRSWEKPIHNILWPLKVQYQAQQPLQQQPYLQPGQIQQPPQISQQKPQLSQQRPRVQSPQEFVWFIWPQTAPISLFHPDPSNDIFLLIQTTNSNDHILARANFSVQAISHSNVQWHSVQT